jgi:hypothetical protein
MEVSNMTFRVKINIVNIETYEEFDGVAVLSQKETEELVNKTLKNVILIKDRNGNSNRTGEII